MKDVIAERKLVASYPNDCAVQVTIRIGRPMPHPKGDWGCPVQGEGLRVWEGPTEIVGIDAWQALTLGLLFLRKMLRAEVEEEAVFHWEDGEDAIQIDELFAVDYTV